MYEMEYEEESEDEVEVIDEVEEEEQKEVKPEPKPYQKEKYAKVKEVKASEPSKFSQLDNSPSVNPLS